MSMTVKRSFRMQQREKGRKEVRRGELKPEVSVERVPRISRLMALAIRFDEMIRAGEVKDQAELARLGRVSRARLSQIMNLLNLAPEIQEELLFVAPASKGKDRMSERAIRNVLTMVDWRKQKQRWIRGDVKT